ncbi:unnamed protein product, partial [Litomosoides sigmodontis]
ENEESSSKSEDSWDEENLEEMEVLAALNSFRNETTDPCVDIFNFIRHENLIRTVMRQAWRMQRLKRNLYELEQKMNYLVAHYVAEKCCAYQNGECSECDSGCHTDRSNRSSSSNNSRIKLFVTKRRDDDETNELTIASQRELPAGVDQDLSTAYYTEENSELNSDQITVKLSNELGKLSSTGRNTYSDKSSTLTLTSARNAQTANDFSSPTDHKVINL